MNERIKELVNTYADVIAPAYPAGVYSIKYESGGQGTEFTEECLIEFAKLIINECYGIVIAKPNIGTSLAGANIKKHFGL